MIRKMYVVLMGCLLMFGIISPGSAYSDESEIKSVIEKYFTLRYEGQKQLKEQDFSMLVEDNKAEWVVKEKDKREIELYVASTFRLNYVEYKFTLDFDSIEIQEDVARVTLSESHEVIFEATSPIVSKMGNLQHIFVLHQVKGIWLIADDQYQDDLSEEINKQSKAKIIEQIDENYRKTSSQTRVNEKVLAKPLNQPLGLTTYTYSRNSAKNYADTYWNTTNPPYYIGLSSDCTNFVSQAIYAGQGKTPPTESGMQPSPRNITTDWYYVWNNSGSVPWVNVSGQYSFITGNTSKVGPYGSSTTSYCNTDLGDVVQLRDSSGNWFHEGMIVQIMSQCGGLPLYLVDAHTTNRYHYPLANWATYTMRFIRVNGWRGN